MPCIARNLPGLAQVMTTAKIVGVHRRFAERRLAFRDVAGVSHHGIIGGDDDREVGVARSGPMRTIERDDAGRCRIIHAKRLADPLMKRGVVDRLKQRLPCTA